MSSRILFFFMAWDLALAPDSGRYSSVISSSVTITSAFGPCLPKQDFPTKLWLSSSRYSGHQRQTFMWGICCLLLAKSLILSLCSHPHHSASCTAVRPRPNNVKPTLESQQPADIDYLSGTETCPALSICHAFGQANCWKGGRSRLSALYSEKAKLHRQL